MDEPGILSQLPENLHYLISPALRFGRYQFDDEIFAFLDRATGAEMDELASVAEHVLLDDDYPRVNAFLDRYEITDFEEAACLYFLFLVLDYADLPFDRVPEE